MATSSTTRTVTLPDGLSVTVAEAGAGRPVLILHGGGGPLTVATLADHLAETVHTITPTHPGWNGTDRPDWLTSVDDLAVAYLRYLEDNQLRDVLVIGSSIGGWIGSAMACQDSAGLISGLILIDAVGIHVDGEPIVDFYALDARGVAEHAYHDADRFYVDPATVPAEQAARQQSNMATMRVLVGADMYDPTLGKRIGDVQVPTLAIWGDSDRIVTPGYGAAFAAGFPNGRLEIVRDAGHLPQIEQPLATFALIDGYLGDKR
jgi:pimeloyl-ACP methyl ester carboxylesterase